MPGRMQQQWNVAALNKRRDAPVTAGRIGLWSAGGGPVCVAVHGVGWTLLCSYLSLLGAPASRAAAMMGNEDAR